MYELYYSFNHFSSGNIFAKSMESKGMENLMVSLNNWKPTFSMYLLSYLLFIVFTVNSGRKGC